MLNTGSLTIQRQMANSWFLRCSQSLFTPSFSKSLGKEMVLNQAFILRLMEFCIHLELIKMTVLYAVVFVLRKIN